jgi:hypothetical protein
MRESFGFPRPPAAVTSLLTVALRTRGRLLRLFPPRRAKHFITGQPQRSWPRGYRIDELGPPPLL